MKQEDYFRMYRHTVKGVRSVDDDLKVGGPASSNFENGEAPWVRDFITFCERERLPLDFISVHPYPNDWPKEPDGTQKVVYREKDALHHDLTWLRETIDASPFPNAETMLTEWNASADNNGDLVLDTAFMAPFVVHNNLKNIGLVDSLGFWVFTDIIEEAGAPDTPFNGWFGMVNLQGLHKPSYHGYWFLGRLGDRRIAQGDNYIVTRKESTVQILMWNYCHYKPGFYTYPGKRPHFSEPRYTDRYSIFGEGSPAGFEIAAKGLKGRHRVLEYTFDRQNGSVFDAWLVNGMPLSPDSDELAILQARMNPTGKRYLVDSDAEAIRKRTVQPHGVTLVELKPGSR
jgi:xylan 1,4-beta-xylosidase